MLATLTGMLLLVGAADLTTDRTEEQLVTGTIAELRSRLPSPPDARFRRVHLRRSTGADGIEHVTLCGQVDMDDPRGPPGWTVFAAATIGGRPYLTIGRDALVDANAACSPTLGTWDYERDFSPRIRAELSGR